MMDEITPQQLVEWRAYSILEPFLDVRISYYLAAINKSLWDINRDTKKHPRPFPLEDFLMKFGSGFAKVAGAAPTRKQSMEEKRRVLELWALAVAKAG